MVDLGPPEVGSHSEGIALNASGLVTGDANDSTGYFAFVSSGDGTPMTRIYDGLGGSVIYPYAINDLGQLTGDALTTGDSASHAFVWKNDGSPMLDLGTFGGDYSYGNAINASGQVAGNANLSGDAMRHAFVWKNDGTPMLDLGTLGGDPATPFSSTLPVRSRGQLRDAATRLCSHAFFWRNDGTPMQDLGTLGGAESSTAALNDAGQVAGTAEHQTTVNAHAFVWMNDGTPMKDLGTLGGTYSSARTTSTPRGR